MGKSGNRKKKSTAQSNGTTATATATATAADPDPSVFLKRVHELKEEGNRLFNLKDFPGALRQYELGLKLLPRAHPDRAVLHSNRAACLISMRPVDHEAVAAECSLALQAHPRFPRALLRRARALDALRRPELALQDLRSLLSLEPDNQDALQLLRKLQQDASAAVASPNQDLHSRPSPAALGASAVRGAPIGGLGPCLPARPVKKPPFPAPAPSPAIKPVPAILDLPPLPNGVANVAAAAKKVVELKPPAAAVKQWRPLKLVYDHDIRLAQMPAGCGFRELREVVRKRFPSCKSVLVKYKDSDGDLVTVTNNAELRLAESSVDRESKEELATLRLHVVEVSPEQEPPLPEEEEEVVEEEGLVKGEESVAVSSVGDDSGLQGLENEVMKSGLEEEAPPKEKDGKKECDQADCKEVEIDDWLFEFAQLFRQQVGIDPDAHLDLHELGMELCSEALEETVTSDEAQGLFDMAAAKFQEVVAPSKFV